MGQSTDNGQLPEDDGARGVYFAKKDHVPEPLPTYAASRPLLPAPVLEGQPDWVAMYWKCWELAFDHLRQPDPDSPFVSNYVDEAFNNNIFQWDTIFMVMFWRYAHAVFPAAQSFDNFYCRQHSDGFICREIWESGPRVGRDHHKKTSEHAINPPLFSWAEVEYYRLSGDKQRLTDVLPVLEQYVGWLEHWRVKREAEHGLYWQSCMGSGMDNTPQTGSAWVEMSAQMVRQYEDLAFMARALGLADKASVFTTRGAQIAARINRLMWDKESGFYWNLNDDGSWSKCRTIGFSWPLMAGIPSATQAERVARHLADPATFYRLVPFATLSADEQAFDPRGGYWLGSSWAPTTYQAVKGLERYGYEAFATQAVEKYLAAMAAVLAKTGTIWENYAPDSHEPGEPAKEAFVGWSGCGPIALLIENVIGLRPDAARGRVVWRLTRTDRHGIERLRVGNATLALLCAERHAPHAPANVSLNSDRPFEVQLIHPTATTRVTLQPGEPVDLTIP